MEHKFNTQINQSGRLMKEFVDTVISFYQNIKQQDVSRLIRFYDGSNPVGAGAGDTQTHPCNQQ